MDAAITVVNVHTHRPDAHGRYVGPGSPFGNPFVVGTDGDRDECVAKFAAEARLALAGKPNALHPDFAAEFADLRARHLDGEPLALACFCAPLACHGDVIKALLAGDDPVPITNVAHVTGDATRPQGDGHKIIAHIVNDRGGWGAGFSGALSDAYPEAEHAYRRASLGLGDTLIQAIDPDLTIVHLCAQRGYRGPNNPQPLDYTALRTCLAALRFSTPPGTTIHMPRIGGGLGGGDWATIEALIAEELADLPVVVHTPPASAADPPPPPAGDRPVCVVASPRRGRTAFRDLDEAFAAIAKAKERGGYLLVGIVGSREREGEREGRLVEEAVAGLCAYHEIPLDKVCVVSGGAQGLDRVARRFAEIHRLPYVEFPALWAEHGKRAGYVRNEHLVAVCDELIAGPGSGGGTTDAMQRAREKKIPVTTI